MNKKELLADLKGQSFIDAIVNEPELQETKPNGDKWYLVNVREVVGNAANYRNINFYVVDEGKATEKAYYKDKEVQQTVATVE